MADVESGITNVRERGMNIGADGVEWYAPAGYNSTGQPVAGDEGPTPGQGQLPPDYQPKGGYDDKRRKFELNFANEEGTHGLHTHYATGAGVGPMQLTSIGLKHEAD